MFLKKVFENYHIVERWSKANASVKRKVSRQYLDLWCVATSGGSRHSFEGEWGGGIHSKKRKIDIDCQTAVAASQPATAGAAASEDSQ